MVPTPSPALLPERVSAVGCLATLAPLDADGFDRFAGMATNGASPRAALLGRAERTTYAETEDFDPDSFTTRWPARGRT